MTECSWHAARCKVDRSRIVASSNVMSWRAVGGCSDDLQEGMAGVIYESQLMRNADVAL